MLMNYLFIFSNGVSLIIPANSKIEATITIESKFSKLFKSYDVKISQLGFMLDEQGNIISEGESLNE